MKSPIFEYYVYSVYRLRGAENARCRVFRVFAPGHHLAKLAIRGATEQQEIEIMTQSNKLDLFFKSVKRMPIKSQDEEFRDKIFFVTEFETKKTQLDFLQSHRVQLS